ncbi:chromosome partitioning protein [Candidatus Marinamargulisbacteria bacterium SCGC AG-343-D04]|nr:chromosome partitioning protein [Candidatus Marinamargulisbacteria bacterium SCGC AG-343-D04]
MQHLYELMKEKILKALSSIIDPDLGKDIVSLNFIKNLTIDKGRVSFSIELTTPACPVKDLFKKQAEDCVKAIEGVEDVQVTMTAQAKKNPLMDQDKKMLDQVASIIVVSSCKGGVGKSTMAVNLAIALKEQGATVGLFDADVYGPSLPTMIHANSELVMDGPHIKPINYNGLKCMSFGYALEQSDEGPAILRGPMVSQIVSQFLLQTKWGECDYLVIDLPPGTGDIQLTLCQLLPITAAITVTTPQHISFIDVVKGIEMFDRLKVPVIGAVENMSYLEVGKEKTYPFGQGSLKRLINEFGFQNTISLELDSGISECGDKGVPYLETYPKSKNTKKIHEFTQQLVRDISIIKHGENQLPKIGYNQKEGIIIKFPDEEKCFDPKALRLECRSALTRDEFTNDLLIKPEDISDDIHPLSMNPVGNYALGINWSDGHSSLYPYEQLKTI